MIGQLQRSDVSAEERCSRSQTLITVYGSCVPRIKTGTFKSDFSYYRPYLCFFSVLLLLKYGFFHCNKNKPTKMKLNCCLK